MLADAIRAEGGLGYYVVVIRGGGKTESFKGAHHEIDGIHFYSHMVQTLNDDFRKDIDREMVVAVIPLEVAKILKDTTVKCGAEAKFRVIDFGFKPPSIWEFCVRHTTMFEKTEKHFAKEAIIE